MLDKIKKQIFNKRGKNIKIKINNIRNKSEYVDGIITEVYDRFFVVMCSDGITRSFNYSDILTTAVEII